MTETAIEPPAPRIRLSRKKGWRMPGDGWKVDRSTPFGNPYRVFGPFQIGGYKGFWEVRFGTSVWHFKSKEEAHKNAVRLHAEWLMLPEQALLRDLIRVKFKGFRPACWCGPDEPCHGDTIAAVAWTALARVAVAPPEATKEGERAYA